MRVEEFIEAQGHPKLLGTHPTTFEFTKDTHLTERGNCIIGVGASKGASDLSNEFKRMVQSQSSRITIFINVGKYVEVVKGYGNRRLILTDLKDIVVRKSNHICGRTLMIESDKAAIDLSRKLISLLQRYSCRMKIRLVVENIS